MKIFLLTKKNLLLGLSVIAGSCLTLIFAIGNSFFSASNKKLLPIYKVNRDDKVVSISFDAAWGNEYTTSLLETLKKNEVKATFFLVGMWVDKYPDSVKEISDQGHDIGNHSDTHPHLPKQNRETIREQIENCNDKIEKITGKRPTLFRPPYGDYDNKLIEELQNLNMYTIQWNIDTLDWKDKKCDEMCAIISKKLVPGSIILMHNGAKYTAESLDTIIKTIKDAGYTIIPISEIIYNKDYVINQQGEQITNYKNNN